MSNEPRKGPGYESVRVGVKALIVRGTSILFNENTSSQGESVFVLPGGGQEHSESQLDALQRECEEEIGVRPRVYDLAFTFDLQLPTPRRHEQPDHSGPSCFHQQNLAFWCDLPAGAEPHMGEGADVNQVGLRWLEISELHQFNVQPREVAQWLQSDPSIRPRTLGTISPTRRN